MCFPRVRTVLRRKSICGLTHHSQQQRAYSSRPSPTLPFVYAGHGMKYATSKTVAHQATQDFLQQEKPNSKLNTFHPSSVIGDSLIQKTAKDIDGMNAMF